MLAYLLDENLPPSWRSHLLHRDPALEIWCVGDPGAPTHGTPDPEILLWCESNNCQLITDNRRTMPVHLQEHLASGHYVPGILIVNREVSLGQLFDELILIARASADNEFSDQITWLPVT